MKYWILAVTLIIVLGLAGCSSQSSAATQVEAYLQALLARDAAQLSTLSCADWEDDAQMEMESFFGVEARLEGLACQESGQDGDYKLVTCQGQIIATYDGEDQPLELSSRAFAMLEEGGEWRMCGYR